MYIFFTCEGVVTTYWGINLSPGQDMFNVPLYIPSITIKTSVGQVKIIKDMPNVAIEGEELPWNPIVQVLGSILNKLCYSLEIDNNGIPLQNRMVIAKITTENGIMLPYGYRRKVPGYVNKYLIKPIPGIYDTNFLNPLSGSEPVIPILTDSNGYVQFQGMYFSQSGAPGE